MPAFVRAAGAEVALLFLENCELGPTEWVRALHRPRWDGRLDGLQSTLGGLPGALREPVDKGRPRPAVPGERALSRRHDDALSGAVEIIRMRIVLV